MPIKATEIRRGTTLMHDGQLHMVLETDHVKPGKGPAYVQAKMKNIESGVIKINRISSSDRVDDVHIDRAPMPFLYDASGRGEGPFVFMDNTSFEQVEVPADVALPEQTQFLIPNLECNVMSYQGRVLGIELPPVVELKVTETAPQVKGATATNQSKEAIVETGAKVRVPPFIEIGQVVRIDTITGEYLGKA